METLRVVVFFAGFVACVMLITATPTGYVKRSPSRALMYTGYFTGSRANPHRQYLDKTEEVPSHRETSRMDTDQDPGNDDSVQLAHDEDKKSSKPPKRHNDDEDDWDSRGAAPSFNAYFPLMFGGGWPSSMGGKKHNNGGGWGMMTAGEEGGQMPGVATAIANSFSTGRGAVASSHAVAYGTPQHRRSSTGSKPKTDW